MSVVPNFDINWNELEQIEMDDELEKNFLQLTALDVPLNIHIDENTIVTVAEVHQPPCSEPTPTQPYIETDPVPSPTQPYTEETSSEAETILPGPITMATESVHSVSGNNRALFRSKLQLQPRPTYDKQLQHLQELT